MKKIFLILMLLFVPFTFSEAANDPISNLPQLSVPPANDDWVVVVDISEPVTANKTKKSRVDNLLGSLGGGGDLGNLLSSSGHNIFSSDGTVSFDGMAVSAERFVSTGTFGMSVDNADFFETLTIPIGQNIPIAFGQLGIETNLGQLPSSLVFMGPELTKQVAISVDVQNALNATDGQAIVFDEVNKINKYATPALPAWGGTVGTVVYPLTPESADLFLGDTSPGSPSTSTASSIFYHTGALEINKQKAAVDTVISCDNETNCLFVDGSADRIGIGTNNPSATLEVVGPIVSSGTGVSYYQLATCASSNPCAENGGTVPNKAIFCTTGNLTCFCNASGADIDIADGTSCF